MKANRSPSFSAAVRIRPARRCASLLITGGLLISTGACAMPGRPASTDALTDQPPVDARPNDVGARTAVPDRNVHHAVVSDPTHHEQLIQPLSHETEQSEAVDNPGGAAADDGTAIRYLPDPRIELTSYAQPGTPGDPVPVPAECAPYPEEVLCDGGDRAHPFHREGDMHGGLETEDTVAEFIDSNGKRQVRPSTRACVYAPRFGAVRSISQPVEGYSIAKLAGAHDGIGLAGLDRGLAPDVQAQTDQLRAMQFRTRASGVEADAGDSDLIQVDAANRHAKILNVYEDRAASGGAEYRQTDEAYLAHSIQRAATWNRDQNPVIVASDEFGQEITAKFRAEEYIGAEDRRTPGALQIIKLADKSAARPGDVVKFTIRFRNEGGRELSQVRILDHLTPRLEYVPESALTELEGNLSLETEEDGSQVLTFSLDQPLAGGATGEITFACRVR
jgi:uncharacterized repeat protein (TIGR01451 family)